MTASRTATLLGILVTLSLSAQVTPPVSDAAGNLYTHGRDGARGFWAVSASDGKELYRATVDEPVTALALDATGSVYLGGAGYVAKNAEWRSAAPSAVGALAVDRGGFVFAGGAGFIGKVAPDGSRWEWTWWMGWNPASTQVRALALAGDGGVYLAGTTTADDLPLRDPHQGRRGGASDAFLARLSADGQLLWSTYLGGEGDEAANLMGLDPQGNPVIGGSRSNGAGFVARFSPQGRLLGPVEEKAEPVVRLDLDAYRPTANAVFLPRAQTATTVAVDGFFSSATYGTVTPIRGTVSTSGGQAFSATGSISFYDGVAFLGRQPIVAGTGFATMDTTSLAPGKHSLWVRYSGDATYSAAASSKATYNLNAVSATGFNAGPSISQSNSYYVATFDYTPSSTQPANYAAVVNRSSNQVCVYKVNPATAVWTQLGVWSTGASPSSVAVGDFNGDGYPDLAVTNSGDNTVSILLATYDTNFRFNGFSPLAAFSTGSTSLPRHVAVADFNGDGIADLAVAHSGTNAVGVYLGAGDGTFSLAHTYTSGNTPNFIAVADFNGDGKADIAVANANESNASGQNTVTVYLGNGDGTLSSWNQLIVGNRARSIAVGDFNGDGKPDLATANFSTDSLSIFLQNSGGTGFNQVSDVTFPSGTNPWSLVATDFNGDGKVDFLVSGWTTGLLYALTGNGSGGFTAIAGSPFTVGANPGSIAVGDFDANGTLDVVVGSQGGSSLSTLLGGNPVAKTATSITLTTGSSSNTSTYGAQVSLGATATPSGLSGSIAFYDGFNLLGTSNSGSLTVLSLTPGGHTLTARYNGDSTHLASTSAPVTFTVTPVASSGFVPGTTAADSGTYFVAPANINNHAAFVSVNRNANTVSAWTGNGSAPFSLYGSASVGSSPTAAVVADFNGDGKPDIAVTNSGDNTVTILLGNGVLGNSTGGFNPAPGSPISVGGQPQYIATGDFNGDGIADLAVANFQSTSNSITILLGNGDGTFHQATGSPASVGSNPWFIAVADINGDGKADLVVPNGGSSNAYVLLGNGDGTFTTWTILTVGSSARSVAVADFNGDGRPDLAFANYNNNSITIYVQNSTGTGFSQLSDITLASGTNPWNVVAFDFDADGKIDLAVTGFTSSKVYVFKGNGNGTFSSAANSPVSAGTNPSGLLVEDFNGDGRPDLAVADQSGNVTVLKGAASATVTLTSTPNPSRFGQSVTLGATLNPQPGSLGYPVLITDNGAPVAAGQTDQFGKISVPTAFLMPGTRTLKSSYSPGPSYFPGTGTLTQTVTTSPISGFVAATFGAGTNVQNAISADFNGDGIPDYATANSTSNSISVYLGGNGGFTQASGSPYTDAASPQMVVVGDFNNDGKIDLAIANANNSVTILLGNGDGTFSAASGSPFSTTVVPFGLVVGDFNGDGIEDLALAGYASKTVEILQGSGTGTFSSAAIVRLANAPARLVVTDFNTDGNPDIVVASPTANVVTLLTGLGQNNFAASTIALSGASNDVAVADFDGDGKLDLAIAGESIITVLRGDGVGGFTAFPLSPVSAGVDNAALVISDFNSDGKPDLAFLSSQQSIIVLLNTTASAGNASFAAAPYSPFSVATTGPNSLAVGDFNGDGAPDILTANSTNNVSILRGAVQSSVTLSASPSPSTFGSSVTLTATVSPTTVSGYVTFYDGVNVLGSAFASGGSATLSTNQLGAGTHSLYVYFAGGPTTVPSTSARVSQTVNTTVSNGGLGVGASTISTGAYFVAAGDINGDGKSDLVAVNRSANTVSVWLGNGAGGFTQSGGSITVGSSPTGVVVADLNRDGRADLAVSNSGSNTVTILLQNANGTFSPSSASPVAAGSLPQYITTGDFNGDGIPDLAVVDFSSNDVKILIGDGVGGFPTALQHTVGVGTAPWFATVVDFNGDGKADLAVSNGGSSNASLFLGNGDGTFTGWNTLAVGSSARSIATGFFDGDSRLDVAVGNYNNNTVSVFVQNSAGTGFIQKADVTLPGGANPWTVVAGDFNADGKTDLAIGAFSGNSVYLYLGNGDGTFRLATGSPFSTGNGPGSLVIGDFNGDGTPDLAIANQNDSTITFLVGTNSTTTTLAVSPNPVSWGVQGAFLTATVTPAAATGQVTFYADSTVLGTATLSNGSATYIAFGFPPTATTFRARYQGSAGYLGSASSVVTETVHFTGGGALSNSGSITQASTRNVSVADLDGNGRPDFVSANSAAGTVSVWYNNNGGITAGPVVTVGTNPFASVIGDFNRDGKPDIAVVNFGSANVSILLQGANNTFSVSGSVAVGTNPIQIASGDFNGDGLIDLAVANYGPGTLTILLGNGDGTFRQPSGSPISTVANPQFIGVADLNGDGIADLVVTGAGNSNNVAVLLGNGTGGFAAGVGGTFSAGQDARSVAIADLNGDGKLDLAITGFYTDNVTILLQKSDRSGFNSGNAISLPAGSNPLSVVAVDFDADGQIDLAVGTYTSGTVTTFKNNAATFTQSGRYAVAAGPGNIAVAGIFTNGTPDLAVSGQNGGAIALLQGVPGSTVSLSATPVTSTSGTPVVFSLTLAPIGASGTVTLYDGASILGTAYIAPLTNSVGTFTAKNLAAGAHSIRAYYAGDSSHAPGVSATVSVTVNALVDYTVGSSTITTVGGSLPQALVTADFNNDGRLDIAAIDVVNQTIRVSLAQPSGGPMHEATGSPISDTHGPVSLVAGDFNRDGKMDLAIANATDHSVTILLGDGTGGFSAAPGSPVVPNTPGSGSNPMRLAIADFNGDGIADLIVTTPNANTTTILLGNGLGGFAEWSHYNVSGQVAIADFNGDGIPDFAVTGSSPSVWLGDGGGGFHQVTGNSFGAADKVVAGYFDSDTRADLAFVNSATGTTTIWLGNGQGGFSQHGASFAPGSNIAAVVAADFSGDGKQDLAFGFGSSVQFWLGDGAGGFAQGTPATATVTGTILSMVAADVDRDGRADVVVGLAVSGSGAVQVLRGLAATTTLSLTASPNPVALGNPVTLTATVSPSNATGKVVFYSGAIVAGFGTVTNGVATIAPSSLPAGSSSVRAMYLGDANFATSQSTPFTLGVATGNAETYIGASYVIFGGATEMRLADLNNDGIEDFVFVNNNSVQVCLGGGIPQDSYGYPNGCNTLTAGSSPVSVAVADYNKDGYPDLAVANITEGTVVVLPGNGDGTFGSPSTVYTFGQNVWPNSIAAADFDEDGNPDLVVTNLNAASVAVLMGDGQGGFTLRASLPTGTGPYSVLTTDLNKDSHADIAVYNYVSHSISLYRGDGFGAFTQAPGSPIVVQATNPGTATALATADLNGDGYPDFIVPNTFDSNILTVISNGSGGYTAGAVSVGSIGGGPGDLSLRPTVIYTADVNGDGHPDLIVGGNAISTTTWHEACPYVDYFPNRTAKIIAAISTFHMCDGESDYQFPAGIIMTGDGSGNFTQFINSNYTTGQTTPSLFFLPEAPVAGISGNPYPYNGTNNMATLMFGDATHIYGLIPEETRAWTATLSHGGSFARGQSGQYTVNVRNSGSTGIYGPVTVTDVAPAGMTVTAMSGAGWDCSSLPKCTRPDGVNGGGTYQPITVTVSVSQTAATPLVNLVSVLGDIFSTIATDSTNILFGDTLTIQKSHSGSFYQGQVGAQYSLTVSNTSSLNSGGTITVTDTPPSGMTITGMSGTGWTCAALPTCSRSDVLAGGSSFPAITVTVNVAANAGSPLVNQATVSGGNAPSASTSDSTVVNTIRPVFVSLPSTVPTGTVPSFTVQLQDSQGTLLAGLSSSVTITSAPSGVSGTLTASTVNGVATFGNVVVATPGTYTLTASTSIGTATATIVVTLGPPSKLVFTTAPPSSGITGITLPALAVQVQDASGNPEPGSSAPVTISSSPSGVSGTLAVNATTGVATFSNLVFNSPGTYTITAASSGLASVVSANLTITTAHLVFVTQPSTGLAGVPVSTVSVQITDSGGSAITGVAVPISLASSPTGVGGTLTATPVNGVATFNNLVFGVSGSYTLTASATGVTIANSTAIAIAPVHLVFTTQPSSGLAGVPISSISIQISDPGGNPVSSITGTVSISSTPTGVGGTLSATPVNGVATFNNLVFSGSGSYTLTASASGVTSANSAAITISPVHLVFTTQPSSGTAGTALTTVSVQISDPGGNPVSGISGPVSISSTPAGVGGTLTATPVNGVATFNNLILTSVGSYTLNATASGTTGASSSSIAIGAGAAAKLVFSTQPPSSVNTNQVFGAAVQVQDAYGNPVSSTAQVAIGSPVTGTTTVGAVGGLATFTNLIFPSAGTYSLNASSPGLSSTSSNSIVVVQASQAQTITFTLDPSVNVAFASSQNPYALPAFATASSGLQVSFVSTTPSVCTVSATSTFNYASAVWMANASVIGYGTCSITASQPGGGIWLPASPVTQTILIDGPLAVNVSHSGSFYKGQNGAKYSVRVSNASNSEIAIVTNVAFAASQGMTISGLSGSNWSCSVATVSCTRSTPLGSSGTFETILVTVNFDVNAASPGSLQATATDTAIGVSATATDSSALLPALPTQTIAFNPNTSLNIAFASPANPYSLRLYASATSGLQVSFASNSPTVCTVPANSTFDSALQQWTVTASVIGYGTCSITASQPGVGGVWMPAAPVTPAILIDGPLATTVTHTGSLQKGQNGARYSVWISNVASAGIAIVTNVAFAASQGITITGLAGSNWACSVATLFCTRSTPLGASGTFETILVTVNINANATSPASLQAIATDTAIGVSNTGTDSSSLLPVSNRLSVSTTSTTLAVAPSSTSTLGHALTLTASVATVASGQVSFFDGSAVLGVSAVNSSGVATLTTGLLRPGPHALSARFDGATPNLPSTSAPVVATVSAVASTGMLSSSISTAPPAAVAQGDFNGDGIADLVVANQAANTISIFIGNGSGGFAPASVATIAVGQTPSSVLALDFNGDGKVDLAVTNSGSGTVTVLLGDGTGGFSAAPGSPVSVGSQPRHVAAGDFNGDGLPDLAVVNSGDNTVSILVGNGNGSFSHFSDEATGLTPFSIAVADFDGDGYADFAVSNSGSGSVTVKLGNGRGAFTEASGSPFAAGTGARFIVAADLNGDNIPDLAVANYGAGTVSILFGDGYGSFPYSSSTTVGSNPAAIALSDFNGDGATDLAVANSGSGTASILLGNGGGAFTAMANSPFGAGTSPVALVAGEFNGDGRADLAVVANGSSEVRLLLGKAPLVITWANPVAISYGTALSATQLNATANVPGTFAYTPASGTVLSVGTAQTLSVTFTPTDSVNYASATATASITVNKAAPTITWTNPAAITYGTALSATQLNATASVPGTFAYIPASGTILSVGTNQNLSVIFTPTDTTNYATATGTATVTVNKATPTITWANPTAITYGTALSATQLNATASVPGTFAYTPASGTVLSAGTNQTLSVTFTPTDTANYATATATALITVNKATPTITWANPAAITYGTAISGTQLNATASVPGTFAYTPAAGTVLSAGTNQTLSVTFTPTDTANYATATATATITVSKATPTITWANPAAITYGTALSATQLSATASIPGTFAYTPASGTVLSAGTNQALSVTFTPTDTTNYASATATGSITVNRATPSITWANPAAISYGIALSATQLNATATVPGTFAYTPASGTILSVGTAQTLSVTFAPTDATNYATATATASITVNKATPTITWTNPTAITYGTALSATQLNATASFPGTFAYTPASGTVLSAGTNQTLSVTFTPTDTTDYATATATAPITVSKATPTIAWANPTAITYGTALSATQLNATASIPGTFAYTPASGTVLSVGTNQTLSVTFTPTDTTNYASRTATTTITVNPAPPVDVTNQIKATATGLVLNRATNTYTSTLTVTNTGATAIAGPLQIVLTGLPAGVSLTSQTGVVPTGSYTGLPYITATTTPLAPGASVSVSLKFTDPSNAPISYVTKVLSGGF